MNRTVMGACMLLIGAWLLAQPAPGAKRVRQGYQKSEQPLKMFHWRGPGTGTHDCYKQMVGKPTDHVSAPDEPTLADLSTLRSADVVYIRSHGGCLQTPHESSIYKRNTYLLGKSKSGTGASARSINLPTDDDRGPSVVLNWGCENARSTRHGDRFPNALGVNCDSQKKVYVAPKYSVQAQGDRATFECAFFRELVKGDVSVDEAARTAYAELVKNSFSPDAYGSFEDAIDICGNKDLTLDDVRENVEKRSQTSAAPPAAGPGSSPTYVAASSQSTGRYCTNNPQIQSQIPVSPVITLNPPGSSPPPSTPPPTAPSPSPWAAASPSPGAGPGSLAHPAPPLAPANEKAADAVDKVIGMFSGGATCFGTAVQLGDSGKFRAGLALVKIVHQPGQNPQHVEYSRGALFGLLAKPPNELRLPFDPLTKKPSIDQRLKMYHEALHQLESMRGIKKDNSDPRAERNTNYAQEVVGTLSTWATYERQVKEGRPANEYEAETPLDRYRQMREELEKSERTWKPDADLKTWSGIDVKFAEIDALYRSGACGPELKALAEGRDPTK